jgi:hypothetical protein
VRGILGFAGGRVILETDGGIAALDAASGAPVWSSEIEDRLDAALCDGAGLVLAYRERRDDNQNRVALMWLDAANGRRLGTAEFAQLEDGQPFLGALLSHDRRLFAFYGEDNDQPRRELVEFVPK